MFYRCADTQTRWVDKMAAPGFTVPTVQDNSGFVSSMMITPLGFNPADPVKQNTTVTYTASDGEGNTAQCVYKIYINGKYTAGGVTWFTSLKNMDNRFQCLILSISPLKCEGEMLS